MVHIADGSTVASLKTRLGYWSSFSGFPGVWAIRIRLYLAYIIDAAVQRVFLGAAVNPFLRGILYPWPSMINK